MVHEFEKPPESYIELKENSCETLRRGVSGFDLLERQQPCGPTWAEDVVLLIRPTSAEIHVGPHGYSAILPLVAHWGQGPLQMCFFPA